MLEKNKEVLARCPSSIVFDCKYKAVYGINQIFYCFFVKKIVYAA